MTEDKEHVAQLKAILETNIRSQLGKLVSREELEKVARATAEIARRAPADDQAVSVILATLEVRVGGIVGVTAEITSTWAGRLLDALIPMVNGDPSEITKTLLEALTKPGSRN